MDGLLTFVTILLALYALGMVFIPLFAAYRNEQKKKQTREHIYSLVNRGSALTVQQFFAIRNTGYDAMLRYPGIYILYNKTKNMHYVGQALNPVERVNCHFTGKGNGDVYADYKYGDEFTIKIIRLEQSGYSTLNQLEAATIMAYDAYRNGYNKTRGNK